MKRNLSMLLAGLLVLVMASPLYAAPDIKVNGQIRTRLRYWVDIDLDSDLKTGADRRYFDNRTRLGVDAKLSDGVRAVIQLEKYFDFGNIGPNSAASPTTGPGGSALATPGTSRQEPYIRQAFIDFAIPGLSEEGIRFQAGRSFFRVGNGFLWGNSLTGEDGATLYGPLGPGDFKIRYAMTQNQSNAQGGRARFGDNELSHWAVDYKFDVAEKQNVEIYFVGQRDRAVDNFSTLITSPTGAKVRHGDDFWVGGAYTGVAGPIALKAEIIGQFGSTRKDVCFTSSGVATFTPAVAPVLSPITGATTTLGTAASSTCSSTPTLTDIDRKGALFAYGEATYKVTPAWNVGMSFTFATGDDDPTDDEYNNFVAPLAEFTTAPTRVWTDSQFFFGNRTGRSIGNATTNRQFNFWGRGTVDIDSGTKFTTGDNGTAYSPGLFDLQFKTKYTFNKEVTGLFNIIPTWAANKPDGQGRYMGTEIDGKIAYKPYKNLLINTYFGYFFSGGFFDVDPAGTAFVTGTTTDADDAWMFRTEAIVTF
ncbi:MAG: hypothetical protein V3W06_07305 [Acidimicrobiia bacterium]